MIYIVLPLIVLNVVTIVLFGGIIKSLARSHARERGLLIDQLMHLAGKSWTPPPAEQWTAPKPGEPLVSFTATPEQSPLYDN